MNIRMLGNHVLIVPSPQKSKSDGGILLVERYNDNQMYHRVIAKGPGRKLKNGTVVPIEAEVGDRILCHSFDGTVFDFPDGKARIIDAAQIMAVIPQKPV